MKISERLLRWTVKILIALVILIAAGTVLFLALRIIGQNRLAGRGAGVIPDLSVMRGEETEPPDAAGDGNASGADAPADTEPLPDSWQEGDIRYQGVHYRYNPDIRTFLFLGIDRMGEVKEAENSTEGGQSDAIFLLVMNPHANRLDVIGINRDTMTDIDVYTKSGGFLGTTQAQLCLQHGYGDGKEISCERTRKAVSNLFYQLPIHGYCAVNMGAIPLINDAVGGVTLTALETVAYPGGTFREGQEVHLQGMKAYYYLHNRDTKSFESAGRRLGRQKQYLALYAARAMEQMRQDITLPVKLYSTLSKYMVTDVTVDEAAYLAGEVLSYSLDVEHIRSLQGETVMGEEFEEFYADEKALYELILEVFYEPVEE